VAAVHGDAGAEDRHRRLLQGPDRLLRERHAVRHRSGRHADPGAGKDPQPGKVEPHRTKIRSTPTGRRHGRAGRARAPGTVAAGVAEQGRRKPAAAEFKDQILFEITRTACASRSWTPKTGRCSTPAVHA
jgi:hypothetical protein